MKNRTVSFDDTAEWDIDDLYRWIAKQSGTVIADGYLDRIVDHCEQLRHFPERGRNREDLSPGLRTIGFERRVTIAFRITADDVRIVRVLYAGRQFDGC